MLDKPIPTSVVVRTAKQPEQVSGKLIAYDHDTLTISTRDGERTLNWVDLTGITAYNLRLQLIDKKDAQDWLYLGSLAWALGDKTDGKAALNAAVRVDKTAAPDVEAVLCSGAGVLLDPPEEKKAGKELLHDSASGSSRGEVELNIPKAKYQKTTPALAKAALILERADAKAVAEEMNIPFKEIATDHFLIYTDWDPREYDFLKQNMEAAYTAVSRQFDIPAEENVFVGKLVVYMFRSHEDLLKYSVDVDKLKLPFNIAGYYAYQDRGVPHMAMSKPVSELGAGAAAERAWAYVLTHEFTHAFVARYRTGRPIPTWLNEGVAEVIASSQFPRDVRAQAAATARSGVSLGPLFQDRAPVQTAEMYPVMRTITEMLIRKDRQRFLKMFDMLKGGATGSQALQKCYGITFEELTAAWRQSLGGR